MKLKMRPDYLVQEIAGEKILIAGLSESINYSRILVLNDSAAELVNTLIAKSASIEDLVKILTDNYMVEADQAREDVKKLLNDLEQQNVLEQVEE